MNIRRANSRQTLQGDWSDALFIPGLWRKCMMMRISLIRCAHAVAILFFVMSAVQPARATLPTSNQPILVVQDSTSADPYQNFVPELLTTEGLNGFQVAQLADLTSAFL